MFHDLPSWGKNKIEWTIEHEWSNIKVFKGGCTNGRQSK
ncbi:hypothetical protein BSM4216_1350 [Bacillus smithii]|nr:hypothetical protein BSM4216_1350 [Bacillus smithii]